MYGEKIQYGYAAMFIVKENPIVFISYGLDAFSIFDLSMDMKHYYGVYENNKWIGDSGFYPIANKIAKRYKCPIKRNKKHRFDCIEV